MNVPSFAISPLHVPLAVVLDQGELLDVREIDLNFHVPDIVGRVGRYGLKPVIAYSDIGTRDDTSVSMIRWAVQPQSGYGSRFIPKSDLVCYG